MPFWKIHDNIYIAFDRTSVSWNERPW